MKTKVLFRKTPQGEILAVFPEIPAEGTPDKCLAFRRTNKAAGDHIAIPVALAHIARPADFPEYDNTRRELQGLGYVLEIKSRFHPSYDAKRVALLS